MGYTFRVIFEGICAYIPDERFFNEVPAPITSKGKRSRVRSEAVLPTTHYQAGNPTQLQVLLPDLRSTRKPPDLFIAPHFATLRVNISDLAMGTDRDYQLAYRQPGGREEVALYHLDSDDITFDVARAANRGRFSFASWVPENGSRPPRPDLRDSNQVQSLYWLPRISEIAPDFGDIQTDLVRPILSPRLAARIKVAEGLLRTHGFNLQGDRVTPRIWRFAEPSNTNSTGTWNRAVGNRLALEFLQVEGSVRIRLENRRNSSVTHIDCAPPVGSGREVEVVIANVEPENLFAQQTPVGDFDSDFDALYSLFTPLSPLALSIRPVPNPFGVELLGAIEKPCVGGTT